MHQLAESYGEKIALQQAWGYSVYKSNGFKVNKLGDFQLKLEVKPEIVE